MRKLLWLALLLAGCAPAAPVPTYQALAPTDELDDRPGFKTRDTTLENFKEVRPSLFRGGLPTEADFAYLKEIGIKTDISLLGGGAGQMKLVDQEKGMAQSADIDFVDIPLPFREPPKEMVDKFFKIVSDPAAQPVYVHCKRGRDRTGTMVALFRIAVDHFTPEQALEEMKSFGFIPEKFPYYTKYVLNFGPAS